MLYAVFFFFFFFLVFLDTYIVCNVIFYKS